MQDRSLLDKYQKMPMWEEENVSERKQEREKKRKTKQRARERKNE